MTNKPLTELLHERTADFEAERLILDATELLLEVMERAGISRSELADRLGKTKGHVSQVLNGERNMTLRTFAEISHALNHRIQLEAQPTARARSTRRTEARSLATVYTLAHKRDATRQLTRGDAIPADLWTLVFDLKAHQPQSERSSVDHFGAWINHALTGHWEPRLRAASTRLSPVDEHPEDHPDQEESFVAAG